MPDHSEQSTGTSRYGSSYWCIKTTTSQNGEVYLMADELQVDASGALLCIGHFRSPSREEERLTYVAFASGHWTAFYAASVIDGSAVSVDHWEGEVIR